MSHKSRLSDNKISKIFGDSAALTCTLQSGIDLALLKHKQAGNAVCEWRNDKVVWVSAEHIPGKSNKQADKN